jgi:hypothetical protein
MGFKRVLPPPKTLAAYMAEIEQEQANQPADSNSAKRASPTAGSDTDSQQGSLPRNTGNTGNAGNGSEGSPSEMAQIAVVKESPDTGDEPVTEPVTKDSQ